MFKRPKNDGKPVVCVTIAARDLTGASRMGWFFCRWLQDSGCEVIAVCPPRSDYPERTIMDELADAGVEVVEWDGLDNFFSIKLLFSALKLFRARSVTLVLCLFQSDIKVFGLVAWMLGISLMISVQIEQRFYGRPVLRWFKEQIYQFILRRKAKVILCTSFLIERKVLEEYGVAKNRVIFLPNCVTAAKYAADRSNDLNPVREELHIAKDAFVVCSVGKMHEQKGYTVAADAISMLVKDGFKVVWAIAGDVIHGIPETFEYKSKLGERIEQLGLLENVKLLGWRDDIPDVLAACDCILHASLWEGFPLAVLEALSSTHPVVFTDCFGELPSFVQGTHGFMAETGSAKALAEKLRIVLSMTLEARMKMGRCAREYVMNHYDEAVIKRQFITNVEKCLTRSET